MSEVTTLKSPVLLALGLGLAGLGAALFAQIEGDDRGVAPIDSSGALEVSGVSVDVYAKTADAARYGGWREAQRRGWRMLWQKYHGAGAPGLSDSMLDSIVSAIVVENEQIGPNRYIARLGVLFDRVRAGQLLGVSGSAAHSAPLLVVPVQWTGGTPQSFEARTEWQKAWARFRTGSGAIDYVRPTGTGADPLLLNYGQITRPGRRWWRALLDQYGAADVLIPQVRLEHLWPGGPVIGHFSARFGPDNRLLDSFALRVENSAGIAAMMDEGVRRIDGIYTNALAAGRLRPDSSLVIEEPVDPAELTTTEEGGELALPTEVAPTIEPTGDTAAPELASFSIQFETPDVGSVTTTEASVRAIPGIRSASTTSLALGGVSVMRVSFAGDAGMLRIALAARGFAVTESGGTFRVRRGGQ